MDSEPFPPSQGSRPGKPVSWLVSQPASQPAGRPARPRPGGLGQYGCGGDPLESDKYPCAQDEMIVDDTSTSTMSLANLSGVVHESSILYRHRLLHSVHILQQLHGGRPRSARRSPESPRACHPAPFHRWAPPRTCRSSAHYLMFNGRSTANRPANIHPRDRQRGNGARTSFGAPA